MTLHDGLSYRQWQKRNTDTFTALSRSQQKRLRTQGYRNIGWLKVQYSWNLLKQQMSTSSLFDHKLRKGDLTGAIGQSIIAADNAKKFARTKAEEISQCQKSIERQTSATLEKYKLL